MIQRDIYARPEFFDHVRLRRQLKRKAKQKDRKLRVFTKGGGRCWICGTPLRLQSMTYDHVVPIVFGGRDHEGNLMPACIPCNREDGLRIFNVLGDDIFAVRKGFRLHQHEALAYVRALRQEGHVVQKPYIRPAITERRKNTARTAKMFWRSY